MADLACSTRRLGQVKWFTKGIGFICSLDSKEDIFVHHTQLTPKSECYRCLFEGEFVEYQISDCSSTNANKKQAVNVTGITGFPLMCEFKKRNRADDVENSSTR